MIAHHILESSRASMPLYNIVQACDSHDLIGMAAYSNAALDVLTASWCKKNGKTRYQNADLIKKAKSKAESYIESSLSNKIFIIFLSLLNQNRVDSEIVQDIKARLDPANQPSALYKLKLFLRAHNLFPQPC